MGLLLVPLLWLYGEMSRYQTLLQTTHSTTDLSRSLVTTLLHLESDSRGYALSARQEFLDRYGEMRPHLLQETAALLKALPPSTTRFGELTDLVKQKLAFMDRSVDLTRDKGIAAGTSLIATAQGKRLRDRITSITSQIITFEEAQLDHDLEYYHRLNIGFILFAVALIVLSGWYLVRSYQFILRESNKRRRLAAAVEDTARELERSNNDLQHFAYMASHDLQEPLRMISSYLQLLERRYGDKVGQDGKEFIDYAVFGATRMRDMIRGLLSFSKVGRQPLTFEVVDMNRLLAEVLDSLKVSCEEAKAQIEVENLPFVLGDRSLLHSLFQNLITNAIKFRRGESPHILIRGRDNGGTVTLLVEDDGVGFPPEKKEEIFQMFQRSHDVTKYPGFGLGLAVCKRIAERHGARMLAEARPEGGSRFLVVGLEGAMAPSIRPPQPKRVPTERMAP